MSARPTRPADPLRGTVLFVHGLWMTGAESLLLRYQLRRRGWALRVFPYSSLAESLDEVAKRCARDALALARRTLLPVHLLGHSLGGIVIFRMFETGLLAPDRFSGDFCRVVFLGTPSRGSQSARALIRYAPGRRMLGVGGGELLREELPDRWPFRAQLGIVAGNSPRGLGRLLSRIEGPNDGTVAVTETELDGATDRCVLPVSHSGLWLSTAVAGQVAAFLDHGRFDADQEAGAAADRSR
ncbi:MAG TPA: alpha/beta hydrolase [Steroidobacteraceae bacterium]|nr:alpha/beta hydrolase [Steroidobacteraceae bacterium]